MLPPLSAPSAVATPITLRNVHATISVFNCIAYLHYLNTSFLKETSRQLHAIFPPVRAPLRSYNACNPCLDNMNCTAMAGHHWPDIHDKLWLSLWQKQQGIHLSMYRPLQFLHT